MLNRPASDPPGECRSNTDVFRALASRMGLEPELFPDDRALIDEALDGTGISRERLEHEPSVRLDLPAKYAPFAEGWFPTPSGKCELESERMRSDGFDPLPTYVPPYEDPQTRPDLASRYPLQLLSPPRPQFLNSTFAGSPVHRRRAGEPTVEIAAEDAAERGLTDGQLARVFNDRGSFLARVAISGNVRPGVAISAGIYWAKHSVGGSNVNSTTSAALSDMGGGATFFDNLVQVEPVDEPRDF
jgi:anaerobic selenocysteine-containing dehydrogenase